eukprot:TRINITY_DN11966_c0_g1_i1.p1 TRINITY_DN11966_c0_g1~~TRINITY_DN11966_c0_g1_i1.p1  ORF type:complete len:454 (+),score=71.87 TRINITY_DN11966_c0_g1_i1:60-1421(+)
MSGGPTKVLLKGGGFPFKWGVQRSSRFGYGHALHKPHQTKATAYHDVGGWTQTKHTARHLRLDNFRPGSSTANAIRKVQWGDFANKLPTSVYFQPGPINSTDPKEHGLINKPVAPEFAGSYEAKPWVTPELFPDNHPLSRMPAPIRNVAARAEQGKSFWSKPEWYAKAEGEPLTPFEVLEVDVRRVGLWMKGGRYWRIMVTVVVSNGNGVAGLGIGEAQSYDLARNEGIQNAFGNLIAIDKDMWTVPHPIYAEFNRTKVQILPARTLSCSPLVADVMNGFGLKGAMVQIKKRKHKKYKRLMTLFSAMRSIRSPKVIAQQRGMTLSSTVKPLFTYYEQTRRRRGMFEMSPEGRTGFLPPNRVIDNRMPDYLKKKYFAGTQDSEFGKIASQETFRLDAGVERYGKHNKPYLNLESNESDSFARFTSDINNVQNAYVPAWTKGHQTASREEWLAHA